MVTMTSSGLQTGYSSHPSRFRETLELIRSAAGLYPAFDTTDMSRESFLNMYLKLIWNYRDLMVLYFTMRCLRMESEPLVFNNIRYACALLFFILESMSVSMEERGDFSSEEHSHLLFDPGNMILDEMGYMYLQYTMWVDFMFEIFRDGTVPQMQLTIARLHDEDIESMRTSKHNLEVSQSYLFIHPIPIFHISRPVNYETSVVQTAHIYATREMRALEERMTSSVPGAVTSIGFPRHIAPWVDVQTLVARPSRAPDSIGERV